MSDILDEIIDLLPPTTIKKILDFNNESKIYTNELRNAFDEVQQIHYDHITRQLKRKTEELKLRTEENRNLLKKLKSDLNCIKSLKEPEDNTRSLEAYRQKINELEVQIKDLTKKAGGVDLNELFNDIESLNKQVLEYRKKVADVKSKYQCFEGLPPNIEEAKKLINDIKEEIKQNELYIERKFE